MRKVLSIIIVVICLILLVFSYMQWKEKINSAKGMESSSLKVEAGAKSDSSDEDDDVKPDADVERLLSLTSNQDEIVSSVFQSRLEADEVVDFLIVGSDVMEFGEPGYAERLEIALLEAYGDSVNVSTVAIEGASNSFVAEMDELIDFNVGYDVVLFEPLTLNSNGVVVVETQLEHIETFIDRVKDEVEDAVVVLHPPQPLHQAIHYPLQVESVKRFAEANEISYINHWTEWPDKDSDDLPNFLDEDSMPNSDGAEIWANTLITYFIAE
ncbi:SGNH/GDSL hydrolase family protein [Sporosarcina sp. Marseille-Q4063]|uniref:SGNH/GDSL hydrolase family protein n=1 Tax=Sporosarcina sp. Marseille-Q4063 TaxID=2810514 RepID=UPI001BAF2326|nr:SGNH/GDSL hydrolase family protein [Sporosarcina sp. Marseille-Q4063]QUW21242.1 SGNH/GDSL hydrolase family protein [Sporosarcina sp. Marseille-Q4063]